MVALPHGLLGKAGHAPRALVLPAPASLGGGGAGVSARSCFPKGAVNSVKERVRKWLAEVRGIKLGHGQFVDYIVANKISDKSALYSHLEQRSSDKIKPALQGHSDAAGHRGN